MDIRMKTLWRVPALYFATGILLTLLGKVILILIQNRIFPLTLIAYNVTLSVLDLVITGVAGYLLMKDITRREAVISAGIVSALYAIMLIVVLSIPQVNDVIFNLFNVLFACTMQPAALFTQISGNAMIPMFCFAFWPFILVLFSQDAPSFEGKKMKTE